MNQEHINTPVVACGLENDSDAAVAAIKAVAEKNVIEGFFDFKHIQVAARVNQTDINEAVFPFCGLRIEIGDLYVFQDHNVFREQEKDHLENQPLPVLFGIRPRAAKPA